jgi:hypothetical protein
MPVKKRIWPQCRRHGHGRHPPRLSPRETQRPQLRGRELKPFAVLFGLPGAAEDEPGTYIACLFRETAFVSFSAPAVSPPFAADAHLLDCLPYRSLRLAGLLCLIADFILPPATRGRSCLRPRLVRFFAFAIKPQAAATTSRSSKEERRVLHPWRPMEHWARP